MTGKFFAMKELSLSKSLKTHPAKVEITFTNLNECKKKNFNENKKYSEFFRRVN